jgi:hypothetical protein
MKATRIAPSSPSMLFHLAWAYLANNEIEKASQSYQAARKEGFTENSLDDWERPEVESVLKKLSELRQSSP